ncbi:unnamed protein product, partial [Polarella glacialis]
VASELFEQATNDAVKLPGCDLQDEILNSDTTSSNVGAAPPILEKEAEAVARNLSEAKLPDKESFTGKTSEQIVDEAIIAAEAYLVGGNCLDSADDCLSSALLELEHERGTAADKAAANRLRASGVFGKVCKALGQYEAAREMLGAEDFILLWEKEDCKLELKVDKSRKWFDYRLTMELPQPISQVMGQNEESDLCHKAQPQLSEPIQLFGAHTPWTKQYMLKFSVALFNVEVVQESWRYRDTKHGFLLEGITSDFDQVRQNMSTPLDKGWLQRNWKLKPALPVVSPPSCRPSK